MDSESRNEDAKVFFYWFLELSTGFNLSTCPLSGCVRNLVKVVFQCYFGHEIERVPSKFGDVRVPFVV